MNFYDFGGRAVMALRQRRRLLLLSLAGAWLNDDRLVGVGAETVRRMMLLFVLDVNGGRRVVQAIQFVGRI